MVPDDQILILFLTMWVEAQTGTYCGAQNLKGLRDSPAEKEKIGSSTTGNSNFESQLLYQMEWK